MLCQTRDGSPLQGKKQIYLCAHPEDRDFYLKELKEDLYYFINCALWHDDGAPLTGENRAVFDRGMDLVLVPVTERLLFTENEVRDREIPRLLERKVPLLPVITAAGLFDETNRLFENRQVLDLYTKDETALGYFEKLERYLKGVLTAEAAEEELKSAFSGSLFLSYRKKDRAIALELMDRLRQDPALRRVGLWYDEFLTPSENFNEEIKESIREAKGVVMLITPNTLEKENYIITDEYPYAKAQGKPIVGITCGVDPAEAMAAFPALRECRPIEEAAAAAQFAVSEEPKPEALRLYRLGCAYLNGIGTQRHYPYAMEYLSDAAEEYAPAAALLAELYFRGIGAEPDREQGLTWVDRWLEILLKEHLAHQTAQGAEELLEGLLTAARYYDEADGDAECRGLYEDALKLASEQSEERLAEVLEAYGVYLLEREEDAKAARLLESAEGILAEKDNRGETLAEIRYNLGTVYLRLNREEEAIQCFQAALAVYAGLSEEHPERYGAITVKLMGNLGIAYRDQGRRSGGNAAYEQAERWLSGAAEMAEKQRAHQKSRPEGLKAKCYGMLGLFYLQCDAQEKSKACFEKAMEACRAAMAEGDSRQELLLAETQLNYAALLRRQEQWEEAFSWVKSAALIWKKRFTAAPFLYAFSYAKTLMVAGILCGKLQKPTDAEAYFQSALKLYQGTGRRDDHLLHDVAECYLEYGAVLQAEGRKEQGEQLIRHALGLFEKLKENAPHYYEQRCKEAEALL